LQEQIKAKINKLKIEEKKSLEGSLKFIIPYTYIQKKPMRSGNAMSYETWIGISYKPLLATLP
jgi:hypothetical protein